MVSLPPTVGPLLQNEPIPGYVLRARLGSGGYGEVWEAEVPGGLRKAVKFVYGRLDESRAQSELKSLNRIKEIGHPFLLSIERIEIVDGRLVIVTELAHGCLKKRFDACRQAGMSGIPRDELLGYIRDAADALDFIHERHGLQHLDIKPENLLMVGNHVKVADFGLLKDLKESLSMVGGMTAIYCPPEALNGRPSRHSDQYSLAIVYQEMLTGQLPFGGRTAAQLAAQHLHSPPMLAVLPPADQPVLARALAKNPDQRFTSCRAFASALVELSDSKSHASRRSTSSGRHVFPRSRMAATEVLNAPCSDSPPAVDGRPAASEIRDLPRLVLTATPISVRPTVVIGVGGTGARILSQFQERLRSHFGDPANLPAVHLLLLDTDAKDLSAAIFQRGAGSIPAAQTLALPLRAPKDYRGDAARLLQWLSRRWLYNIPRSLQTEGLRPMGRLAFVDHSAKVYDRLYRAIQLVLSEEAIQTSQQTANLRFQIDSPNIFVVASISGGTGSGCAVDLGYAVRKILAELQLPDQRVFGILSHATSRKAASRDLAIVNTLAALQELRQFGGRRGYFPGDPSCDLPAFCENHATFHETYFVPLGNELGNSEFQSATDRVAEYLFQNTLAAGVHFFEESRRIANEGTQENSLAAERVRTFGLTRFDAAVFEHAASEPSAASVPEIDHDTHNEVGDTESLQARPPSLDEQCGGASPQLIACGGARQTLVIGPSTMNLDRLLEANQSIPADSVTVVEHGHNEIVVCQEISEVPVNRIMKHLIGTRKDYVELADRLHTRIDIEWDPIFLAAAD
jgi:eukaryotic-like serine/threonine-protein kinase